MTDDRAFERAVSDWFEDGSDRTPPEAIDAVLLAIRTTRQEGVVTFRGVDRSMAGVGRLAAAIAILAVLGSVGVFLVARGVSNGNAPRATPVPRASAVVAPPSAVASAAASAASVPASPTPAPTVDADIPATAYRAVAPVALSSDGAAMWVMAGSQLERIDPVSGATESFDIGAPGHDLGAITATPQAIWVPDFTIGQVLEVDPTGHGTITTIPAGAAVSTLLVGDTIWVSDIHGGAITRIDASTGRVVDTLPIGTPGDNGPSNMASGGDSVWVIANHDHQVIRVDSTSGKVTARIPFPAGHAACWGMAVTPAAIWVTCEPSSLVRIDPAKDRVVAAIGLDPGDPSIPTIVDGKVWVAVGGPAGVLERIDPATDRVDRKVSVGSLTDAGDARVAFDALWVADPDGLVLRFPLDELRSP